MDFLELNHQLVVSLDMSLLFQNLSEDSEKNQTVHEIMKENQIVDFSSNLQFPLCLLIHTFDLKKLGAVSHVKLNIYPDAGVSRVRVFGEAK